jgi:transcription antitermination factor NusG
MWNAVAKHAEHEINALADRQGLIECEISDQPAQWFLVRTYPGDDARALRWLARRRFGAFRPMQQRRDRITDKLVQGWEPAFPGWIFVLCWNVDAMRYRILSTPGVMGLLCDPATNRPVPIDDGFIGRVRKLSWIYDENAPDSRHHSGVRALRSEKRLKTPKLDKCARKRLAKLKDAVKAKCAWDKSAWETANQLAPHERIALLQRALNAPSLRLDSTC